ncbi:major facilitator superfamily domain-containing protein [Xylariales sp. PMI_506]|nr:major facilitator superfamily domain-containing protein [Xylariales sp. PMI_506]
MVTFSSQDDVAIVGGSSTGSSTPGGEKSKYYDGPLPAPPIHASLHGLPLAAVTAALSMAVFLVAMDVNVVSTAAPRIAEEFSALDDVGWYGSAFLMTTCAFQILFGRVYTMFPAKWIFLAAISTFMVGSVIAATSSSSGAFIFGRAVQGTGTSGILAGGLIIISQVVPLQTRSLLSAVVGAMEGIAMISAPVIGGALTDKLSWRWCFYINLPIGGFVLLAILLFLRIPEENRPQQAVSRTFFETCYQLDILGSALIIPPIICILLALQYGGTIYAWNSAVVVILIILGVVLFGVFGYSQYANSAVAMVPFRIIKQRSVMAGFWYTVCTSSALAVMTYFLPLWYQTIMDMSPTDSGLHLLPMLIGVIFGVLGSGALVSALGYYTPFMIAGTILMSVGVGLLTTITPDTSNGLLIMYPAIFGVGVGVGFQQPLTGAQTVLPRKDIPTGTSIIVFGQTIGAAIVLSIGQAVYDNRLIANINTYLGIVIETGNKLLTDGTSELAATLTAEQQPLLVNAASKSLTQTFYVGLVMATLSIFGSLAMEWRSVKHVAAATAAPEEHNEKV